MAKRQGPRAKGFRSAAERARTRRVVAIMAVTLALLSAGLFAAWYFGSPRPLPEDGHPHRPAPHGGSLVSVGDADRHYHAEAVRDKGFLKVYLLGEDAAQAQAAEAQAVPAFVRPHGEAESIPVALMPVPQPGDAEGKTSRFVAKLPRDLWGKPLAVTVPDMPLGGGRFLLEFPAAGRASEEEVVAWAGEEEKLYRTPGGKYTATDVRANGDQTASHRFLAFDTAHDRKPAPGDRVCPVTRLKADPGCSWVVGGKGYEFCCPPCVDEFVKTAKDHPEEVKDPAEYMKK